MKAFIKQLDTRAIEAAIGQAEKLTSGEIRVVICRKPIPDPVAAAETEFARLKMNRTRDRNGVLLLVAPASKTFAIFGDKGIHEKCGPAFWTDLAGEMTIQFREGKFTEGIAHAIARAGRLLAEHFPHQSDDENELPDKVVER